MSNKTIADTVLEIVSLCLNKQNDKGLKTYGAPLDLANDKNYNWDKMTLEEVIDALQYQVKENIKLEKENRILKDEIKSLVHQKGLLESLIKEYKYVYGEVE